MARNNISGIKIFVVMLLAVAISICGCKKPAPPETPATPESQAAPVPPSQIPTPEPVTPQKLPEPVAGEPSLPEAAVKAVEEVVTEVKDAAVEVVKTVTEQVQPKARLVPINIELPRPMFVGTPQNIRVPNLEKPLGKPRPAFLAPEGTINIAAGKTVASTDDEPIIGELEMVTDSDKAASDGSYVELGPFLQSVTIDLEAEFQIYAVLFWHYHKQPRVYYDIVVQVADDPDFITNVRTIYNNDLDNSSGLGLGKDMHYVETSEGRLVDAKGVKGRFVRLYSNGNTANELNHYIEVEVFGKPAK